MKAYIHWCVLLVIGLSCFAYGQIYRVGSGDTLFVSVWGQDELSGLVIVGPDGTIAMPPPIGTVQVRGMTVEEIAQLLTQRLSQSIKNPRVSVALREFGGFTVHVYGQVMAPGFYKIPDDTTLQEVITRAGGPTEYADLEHIQILHREEEKTSIREINFREFLEGNLLSANPTVGEGDSVFVPRLDEERYRQQRISIVGSVKAPGVYPLDRPKSLLDILALAEGILPDADLGQIHIFQSPNDPNSDTLVDLKAYLSGQSPQGNPIVHPGEAIFVPSTRIPEEYTYLVNVVGQVVRPGAYPVTKRAKLLDAIYLAGGFAERAQLDRVTIIHRAETGLPPLTVDVTAYLLGQDLSANPSLMEGDTILVPISEDAMLVPTVQSIFLKSLSVNVIGEVRNPGPYELSARGGILDALTLAGGPTPQADLKRAAVLRGAGGKQEQIEVDLEEVLTEGTFDKMPPLQNNDTIFIPMQKESWWRLLVRAAADVSTIAIAVLILIEGRRP